MISLLNITPAYLERLRKGGYLQAVAGDSFEEFPAWQFACRPELPVMPGIAYVSPVVPEEWTAAKVDDFMLTPHAALRIAGETLSPAQWLMRGDDPTRIVEILNSL
ncbi:hypothetical protein SRABI98_00028 [Microbacterium sp. Bi98]|nr:hypothetical protein SRABI98_00028 [Microbacterium sp. Bi98]